MVIVEDVDEFGIFYNGWKIHTTLGHLVYKVLVENCQSPTLLQLKCFVLPDNCITEFFITTQPIFELVGILNTHTTDN